MPAMTVKGLQEAQRGMEKHIAAFKPRGALEKIVWLAPTKNSIFLASSILAFWGLGRALRKHRPGAWLFFWLILCYPAVYYFVFPHPRYRHPIEPELGILIIYAISEAERKQPSLPAVPS